LKVRLNNLRTNLRTDQRTNSRTPEDEHDDT
jgi:hypothetical protein